VDSIFIPLVVVIYLLITAILGIYSWWKTKSTSDYLLAGRNSHPFIMAISYGATFISTSAIVGFGGAAAVYGMGILWLTFFNIFVGIFIAFVFFGKKTRRMGLNLNSHTFPEFVGQRYQSKGIQGLSAAIILIGMPLYAAVVLMGGAHFIAQVFKITYETSLFFLTAIVAVYVIMGGLKGVMLTDAFQGVIMFLAMSILVVVAYVKLGGIIQAHESLTSIQDIAVKMFGAKGHTGWTSFPAFGSDFWWVLVSTLVLGVGIGVLAQPQLIVRFMTVKSNMDINRAVAVGGIFILLMTGVAFTVGALSNVYFLNHPDFKSVALIAAQKNVEKIIPLFIDSAMPKWFTALFMVTLLSAAMSTMSSQFHTMGSAIGRDLYEKTLNGKGNTVMVTRIGILIMIVVSLLIAWGLPIFYKESLAIIARGTSIFFGLCAAAFLPMYVTGLYSKNATKLGAYSGLIVGFVVSLFYLLFIHTAESKPFMICQTLFGKPSLVDGTKWAVVDPIVIALPLAFLATWIGNMFGKKLPEKHINTSFEGV